MKNYRAVKSFHLGNDGRNIIIEKGKIIPEGLPEASIKGWLKRGLIEEVEVRTRKAGERAPMPVIDIEEETIEDWNQGTVLATLPFINEKIAAVLEKSGLTLIEDLEDVTDEELMDLEHIGQATADKLLEVYNSISGE